MAREILMEAYFFSKEEFDDVIHPKARSLCFMNDEKKRMESELENIRVNYYPQLPSRLSCTFVAPNYDLAKKWFESIHCHYQGSCQITYFIYEVDIPNDTLWHKAKHLTNWKTRYDDNCLINYWSDTRSGIIDSSEVLNNLYEGMVSIDIPISAKNTETFQIPNRFAPIINVLTPYTEPNYEDE